MPAIHHTYPLASLSSHVETVDARLSEVIGAVDGALVEPALHLVSAGGRRLRPTLTLSSAVAGGGWGAIGARVVDAAVVLELLHQASLCHDDVLDAAPVRRGRASVNAGWGNRVAILAGDALLAQAFSLASTLRRDELLRFSQTVADLCAGQIAETQTQFDRGREIVDYEVAVRKKTAALFASSCWLGASVAGAPVAAVRALERYGEELGVAYQLIDDLLDLYGDPSMTGKPLGADLSAGVFTLPVLLAMAQDPAAAELLEDGRGADAIEEVRRRVSVTGAHRRTASLADEHVRRALAALDAVEVEPEGRKLLSTIAELVVAPAEELGLITGDPRPLGERPAGRHAGQAMPFGLDVDGRTAQTMPSGQGVDGRSAQVVPLRGRLES
jgi:geranylgeranyl pyrophosphate synthase